MKLTSNTMLALEQRFEEGAQLSPEELAGLRYMWAVERAYALVQEGMRIEPFLDGAGALPRKMKEIETFLRPFIPRERK